MLACLHTFLWYTWLHRRPNCPVMKVNYNCPKSHTSHTFNFHLLFYFKSKIYLTWYGGFPLPSATVPLLATPLRQKSPSKLSTSYLLAIHGQFHAASPLFRVGWVVMIKLKTNLSSTGTGLNWNWAWQFFNFYKKNKCMISCITFFFLLSIISANHQKRNISW